MELTDRLKSYKGVFNAFNMKRFDFSRVSWIENVAEFDGTFDSTPFHVEMEFYDLIFNFVSICSICERTPFCPHVMAALKLLRDSGLAAEIVANDYEPCTYSLNNAAEKPKVSAWKSQLGNLAQQLARATPRQPVVARYPKGRETVYVLEKPGYSDSDDVLNIRVAVKPAGSPRVPVPQDAAKGTFYRESVYRNFIWGVAALAASTDELDREIADKLSLSIEDSDSYRSRRELKFSMPMHSATGLLAKVARSGRLYYNSKYELHDAMPPLDWLSDEPFDSKFEIATSGAEDLCLGACAANAHITVPSKEIAVVSAGYFIDQKNRLGLFRNPIPDGLFDRLQRTGPIVVPRQQAGELIEKVMSIPVGLGIEFSGCKELEPQRVAGVPKPRIHIKAGTSTNNMLAAMVHFDYDGKLIALHERVHEFYDKTRSTVVQVDNDFHKASSDLLVSLGVKIRERYNEMTLSLTTKKLPSIVGQLIHHGWHVEADGKLYRTGSRCDVSVVSGIDWFELQGKAHFDQTTIDLPKLLQCLRSGESSIVLDDGTIGVIPEDWIKRFSGVADLGSTEDGSVKFGRSQVGLLDALLVEQGAVNVDEKFAAARQSLREFDRIQPQESPAGFIGELRPYQKLAQGWFEFLRHLGFGGCLADDMGLGKTIQVLALLEKRRELKCGPSLIVVPRSLVFNWTAEAAKFAPKLRVLDQSHSNRHRGTHHLNDYDLILSTYGTLRRDAAFLKDFEFDYVILDEAQAIKNATTEASKAARLLHGKHKLALSGTPIENHLGELWSLFDFLNPGMLGRVGRFAGLAADADADQRKLLGAAVRPFILRRTKKQVAPELPERIEQTILVELDAAQRKSYDELREYYRQMLLKKIDTDGIGKSQIVILEALLRLRQAACHPGLVDKSRVGESSAKIDELLTRLSSAVESQERVLVFSQFTSLLAIVKLRLKQAKIDFLYLDGKTKDRQALVDQFQSGSGPGVFLISLKAGGVGLNLTAARSVYLLDPWWNPAVEAQAIDRAHRIGQQQTVFATRLITADTVEQKVLDLQSKKRGLADAIVNADNSGISSITREDLELLLA